MYTLWLARARSIWSAVLSISIVSVLISSECCAMIEGGTGNAPIQDPGWPSGAAKVFNWPTRAAWWVGPPFGGGQWHAECKGDTEVVNAVLAEFAKIDSVKKRVVVKDGIGYSFWLDPNGKKRGDRSTKIDWVFVIWERDRWEMQKQLPPDLSALREADSQEAPVAEITVYTASVKWSEVIVPGGIDIVDQRLEAHGFTTADGRVLEGIVLDNDSGNALQATVRAERINAKPTGGYDYSPAEETAADANGRWYFKNFPDQWSRIVVEMDGYAPRVIHHTRYDLQPGWEKVDTSLAKAASISGSVVDEEGKPVAEATVSVCDLAAGTPARYEVPNGPTAISDNDGKFVVDMIPSGSGRIRVHREGYVQPGLGNTVEIPSTDNELKMTQASELTIKVKFACATR